MNNIVPTTTSHHPQYEKARYGNSYHILRSEMIYGEGYQSPGGMEGFKTTLLNAMPAMTGLSILEIGSGLGGAAFYIANNNENVRVTGVDTSDSMVSIAKNRRSQSESRKSTTFICGDIFSAELDAQTFDIIYSKDSLMYVKDKAATFDRCFQLLNENGHLCISDFCKDKIDEDFLQYIEVSGYGLPSIEEYKKLIEAAGFRIQTCRDISDLALHFLEQDLSAYRSKLSSGLIKANKEDSSHIIERWVRKINYVKKNKLTQGLFISAKDSKEK